MRLKYEPSSEPLHISAKRAVPHGLISGLGSRVPHFRIQVSGFGWEALRTRHTLEPLAWHWSHWLGIGAIGLVDKSGESVSSVRHHVTLVTAREWPMSGGVRVPGFSFWVPGLEFRVLGSGFRVPGSGSHISGSGFRVPGSGFRVPGCGFRVPGSGFRVPGSGFRVPGSRITTRHS